METANGQHREDRELGDLVDNKKPPKVHTYLIVGILMFLLLCIPAIGWLGRLYKGSAAMLNTIALPVIVLAVMALFILLVLRLFKKLIS